MAASILINNLTGGRNGFDPPHNLPANQCVEALNVDWYGATIARRRGGSTAISMSGGTAPGNVTRLIKFQPGGDDTAAEMWLTTAAAGAVLIKRLAGGTTWADVTGGSLITANTGMERLVETATLDGRLYIAANSATGSRVMVYDPTLSSPQIRYVGFTTPVSNPTMADTGSGSLATSPRFYRIRWIQKDGTKIVRRSEPSAGATFSPSGSGLSVRVTRPTAAGENETHWEVEARAVNVATASDSSLLGPYYLIGTIAIATTTFDDSNAIVRYPLDFTASPDVGEYSTWTNVRYLITDGNRLIGAGSHKTGEKTSRIYYSSVLGATDQGDIERVPINSTHENFIDLNENDGGAITGLGRSMNGAFYAFKRRQIWRITPTGDEVTPYLPRRLSSAFGAISQASIIEGRDMYGNPALYFWSEEGPCRLTIQGDGSAVVQYLGEDIRDLTTQITFAGFNQAFPHAMYYPAKHQIWFWFNYVAGGNTFYVKAVFDVMRSTVVQGESVRGGWSIHGDYTTATSMSTTGLSGLMFAATLGASMGVDFVPYVAVGTSILRTDTTDVSDNSVAFQAYVKTAPIDTVPFGENVGFGVSTVLADPSSGVTIMQSLIRDYGLETRTSTVSLTAAASETKVIRKFEDSEIAGAGTVQVQIGDAAAASVAQWKLHELALTVFPQEPR